MNTNKHDEIFFSRILNLCEKYSEYKESKLIKNSIEMLKNSLSSHSWRNIASSILIFELEHNENVRDLVKYAELRGNCTL